MGKKHTYIIKSLYEDDGENYAYVSCISHNRDDVISRFNFIYNEALEELKDCYPDDNIDSKLALPKIKNDFLSCYAYINIEDRYVYRHFELLEMDINCFTNPRSELFYQKHLEERIIKK